MPYYNKNKITIMDFSHVYEREKFYINENINWIDCSEIKGTNCYCDDAAKKIIEEKMKPYAPEGLHFIDSGNYHYISEFWINKLQKDFMLIVFDHHSDMQKPLFGDIISCGSWIMKAMDDNIYLKKVAFIGLSREQEEFIDTKYRDKVICISSTELTEKQTWEELSRVKETLPVYISVDKDVLSKNVVNTTWDQGNMKMPELKALLHMIMSKQEVIGIDVCGETADTVNQLYEIHNNDMINSKLLQFLKVETDED